MSLAQAFQTAAAYRQGIIDQNNQAAMQTPMLAVQALSVGLQAQAQQQDMQFKMQSMVLQTQLQIEETKTKQAMQLMEFDLRSRNLNLQEQQTRQEYEWKKTEFAANKEFNDLRLLQERNKMALQRNEMLADTFIGAQYARGITEEQLVLGANPEGIDEFTKTYPEAAAVLGSRLNTVREATRANLAGQIDALRMARSKTLYDSRLSPAERALSVQDFASQIDPKERKLAQLENRAPRDLADRGIASRLAAMGTATPSLDPKDGVAILAEVRARRDSIGPRTPKTEAAHKELDQLDQTTYERMGMVRPKALEGPPKQTPLQAALAEAAAAQAKLQSKANQSKDPKKLVEERETKASLANLDAWEGTVGKDIVPTIESVRDNSNDPEQVAEAQKLRSILDAAMEATRRGITGVRKRDWTGVNDGATARRELAPTESRPYPVFGGPGVQAPPAQTFASTTVRSFTRAELDSLAEYPSYENVKRILSRLEVR